MSNGDDLDSRRNRSTSEDHTALQGFPATPSPEQDSFESVQAANAAETPVVSAPEANSPSDSRRRANPAFDSIWTRQHAICTLGAICDALAGGYDAARSAEPPRPGVSFKCVGGELRHLCPWLINDRYLNFEGSRGLLKHGLDTCFKDWVANRVYYFYAYPERSEHPVNRKRHNLRLVYEEFYAAFGADVEARNTISEERARNFWLSVSDRVPFQAHPHSEPVGDLPPLDISNASGNHQGEDGATTGNGPQSAPSLA